ncbi:MAG: hypothetical protein Q8N08_09870 [Methanobacteriaceae archaeon]|nr:hypothetical protein [Methanobacteriaceae archaeon]
MTSDDQFYLTIAKISATLVGLVFVAITGFYLPNVKKTREELINYSPLLAVAFPDYILITSISNLTILLLPLLISFNLLLAHYPQVLLVMDLLFIVYILYFTDHTASVTTQYFIGDRIRILEQIGEFAYFRVAYLPFIIFSVSLLIVLFLIHIRGWYLFLSMLSFICFIFWAKNKQIKLYKKPIQSPVEAKNQIRQPIRLDILSWILLLSLSIGLCIYIQSEIITIVITPLLIFTGLLLISVDYFIFGDKSLFFQLEQRPFQIIKTSIQGFSKRLQEMRKISGFDDEFERSLEEICEPIEKLENSFDSIEKTNLVVANEIIRAEETVHALRELSKNPSYKAAFLRFKIFGDEN